MGYTSSKGRSVTTLAVIAPRLAKAHRERTREIEAERAQEQHRRTMLLRAQRLVAHRELQLVRAGWTHSPRYIAERERKLEAARAEMRRWST